MPAELSARSELQLPTERGLPLGVRLLLYSDGVTEAWNDKEEEYGMKRLKQQARRPGLCPETVLADVRAFSGADQLRDDATVLVVQAASAKRVG